MEGEISARGPVDRRSSGWAARDSSRVTLTAMRLPLTTTAPLGDRQVIGENRHLFVLGGVEFDDGAAAHAQHLVNGHHGRAENHGNVELDGIDVLHDDLGTQSAERRAPRNSSSTVENG